jgi:hypothetical protein
MHVAVGVAKVLAGVCSKGTWHGVEESRVAGGPRLRIRWHTAVGAVGGSCW